MAVDDNDCGFKWLELARFQLTSKHIEYMLLCMRTTLDIDDDILREAKLIAVNSNRTLRAVVVDALRRGLHPSDTSGNRKRIRLPVSTEPPGLQPGVDLDNSAALLDLMDKEKYGSS